MGSSPGLLSSTQKKRKPRAPFERRITRFTILLVLPGIFLSGVLIWLQPWSLQSKLILFSVELIVCLLIGAALHDHVVRPLQTLANVVGSLREEDYSFRARMAIPNDALGELSLEVNALADLLAKHRTGAIEATALLDRVVEEVDIPIFAFDPANKLRLVNSAGGKLLNAGTTHVIGKTSSELGLEACLSARNESLVELHFGTDARWFVRRSSFRQHGIPHTLVVLSDVSRALREEERRAWKRLIRVLGHELNNSLAPIKSIAGSLRSRLAGVDLKHEEQQDFERGLGIIENRAASLNRFLQGYRQLAQMPPPAIESCSVSALVKRVAALETRVLVRVVPGPDISVLVDPDQLEQMLINLLRNAAEAVLENAAAANGSKAREVEPPIVFSWTTRLEELVLQIEDTGPGLMNPGNAFVPFYTTKPAGSGIGLVLSRQIAEAHGGSLELQNRPDRQGCVVKIVLPVNVVSQAGVAKEKGREVLRTPLVTG
ncbi:MAG TPA: ATP-binding protein [Terriglobales bacterium]|jgi:two-component system nitrogen regulation sensor histidine kinase NtrY|nr:ATP-binding protein [Terriglobales bacterium]